MSKLICWMKKARLCPPKKNPNCVIPFIQNTGNSKFICIDRKQVMFLWGPAGKDRMKEYRGAERGGVYRWWICSLSWFWWWFHGWIHISKYKQFYNLNTYSLLLAVVPNHPSHAQNFCHWNIPKTAIVIPPPPFIENFETIRLSVKSRKLKQIKPDF